MRRESLSEDDEIRLNKLTVLAQHPVTISQILTDSKFRDFPNFIDIKSDHYPTFMDRLVDKGLFEKNKDGYSWFKHELVHRCLDGSWQWYVH
jgi:hypothetical protein